MKKKRSVKLQSGSGGVREGPVGAEYRRVPGQLPDAAVSPHETASTLEKLSSPCTTTVLAGAHPQSLTSVTSPGSADLRCFSPAAFASSALSGNSAVSPNRAQQESSASLLDASFFDPGTSLDDGAPSFTNGDTGDSNPLVLLPQKGAVSRQPPGTFIGEDKHEEGKQKMSKRKRRKLEQIQRKHEANAQREQIMAELQRYRLDTPAADGHVTNQSMLEKNNKNARWEAKEGKQGRVSSTGVSSLLPLTKKKRQRLEARAEKKIQVLRLKELSDQVPETTFAGEDRETGSKKHAGQYCQRGAGGDRSNEAETQTTVGAEGASEKDEGYFSARDSVQEGHVEGRKVEVSLGTSQKSRLGVENMQFVAGNRSGKPTTYTPVSSGLQTGTTAGGNCVGRSESIAQRRGSSSLRAARVTYAPLLAMSHIRRTPEVEARRLQLPAAEVEGRLVAFCTQQEHPRTKDADDEVFSDDEEAEETEDEECTAENTQKTGRRLRRCQREEARKKRIERLMKKRRHVDVLCVCGDTGSGKSTQIPQFLFEAGVCYPTLTGIRVTTVPAETPSHLSGFQSEHTPCSALERSSYEATRVAPERQLDWQSQCDPDSAAGQEHGVTRPVSLTLKIGITQPRRVAAVMVSRRVGEELGNSKLVGYHIRHRSENLGPECRIKFMTDGVLLREIQRDFLCSEYACIVIDEAHERSINTDLLIGLLSRVVKLRRAKFEAGDLALPPLKLVIMSASLRASDFSNNAKLFCPPPSLLQIPAKQFHVTSFFSRRTPDDYVQAAIKKCIQAHCKLPPGSILVFVTGREEVEVVVEALNRWEQRRAQRQPQHTPAIKADLAGRVQDELPNDRGQAAPAGFGRGRGVGSPHATSASRRNSTTTAGVAPQGALQRHHEGQPRPVCEEKGEEEEEGEEAFELPSDSESGDGAREDMDSDASQENSASEAGHEAEEDDSPEFLSFGLEERRKKSGYSGKKGTRPASSWQVVDSESEAEQDADDTSARADNALSSSSSSWEKVDLIKSSAAGGEAQGKGDVVANCLSAHRDGEGETFSGLVPSVFGATSVDQASNSFPSGVGEESEKSSASFSLSVDAACDGPQLPDYTSRSRAQVGWRGAGGAGITSGTKLRKRNRNSTSTEGCVSGAGTPAGDVSGEVLPPSKENDLSLFSQLTAVPLYAALSPREQLRAFRMPEVHERIVIVATNVAETSITLPNVRYVIDTGREKRRVFGGSEDGSRQGTATASCVSSFRVCFITQASALQRAGRAGRVGAGFCYRLYSSSVYEHVFEPHSEPAIARTPLDSLLLYMVNLGISRVSVFPFPSSPPAAALSAARERLVSLGALQPAPAKVARGWQDGKGGALAEDPARDSKFPSGAPGDTCTRLGTRLAALPIPPRYAKMLILASLRSHRLGWDCVGLCCLLVAALSVGELIAPHALQGRRLGTEKLESKANTASSSKNRKCSGPRVGVYGESRSEDEEEEEEDGQDKETQPSSGEDDVYPWARCNNDIDSYLWMCGAYCHSPRRTAFCRRFGLNAKRMKEMYLLANQLARLLVPSLKQQATACSKARVSQIEQDTSTEKAKRKNRKSAVPAADASVVLPLKPAPPTPAMRLALHACVVEGFIDHVAVWVEEETRGDFTGVQAPATNNRQRRGGYRSAELKNAADGRAQLAHIHPHSCLARHRPLPSLLVYNYILATSKPFLRDCLAVDSAALAACTSPLIDRSSSFLEIPAPTYDSGRDEVVGWQKLKYTPLDIPLPASEIRLPDTHPALYPVIACAFLQGRLFAKLSLFRDQLIVRPEAALAGCRAPLHAVRDLVKAIQGRRAKNRKAILAAWEEDKTFLLAEYIKLQRFADYERIRKLSDIWPPVDA